MTLRAARIAEVAYLRLGGVNQWVMMRGENVANPPLMLLTGGVGAPSRPIRPRDDHNVPNHNPAPTKWNETVALTTTTTQSTLRRR